MQRWMVGTAGTNTVIATAIIATVTFLIFLNKEMKINWFNSVCNNLAEDIKVIFSLVLATDLICSDIYVKMILVPKADKLLLRE